jgi:two-component system NtrC family sensor kinase
LRLYPRRAGGSITDVEKALVRIVAAQLSATIGQARALPRMETIARQEKLSALGTLVAGVAHEINNPVTYMRGALELARMDLDEVDAHVAPDKRGALAHARVSLGRLAEGVDRVQRITHALKAVARQGNGERAPEDVRLIVEDVAQVVRIGLPKNVALDLQLPAALPNVRANASEMHQVVLNLVKNAAEALGERGGLVTIRLWTQDAGVYVEVADDGPGIPLDVQRRLFEPFFTTKREGTGLGLSLSKGIVEAHGGDMRLDSAAGAGTRFTIRLPALG